MQKIYGPFFNNETNGTWHWRKDCPEFPVNPNPKVMISTAPIDMKQLCVTCLLFDKTRTAEISNFKE